MGDGRGQTSERSHSRTPFPPTIAHLRPVGCFRDMEIVGPSSQICKVKGEVLLVGLVVTDGGGSGGSWQQQYVRSVTIGEHDDISSHQFVPSP